jgi:hypothetical protein
MGTPIEPLTHPRPLPCKPLPKKGRGHGFNKKSFANGDTNPSSFELADPILSSESSSREADVSD